MGSTRKFAIATLGFITFSQVIFLFVSQRFILMQEHNDGILQRSSSKNFVVMSEREIEELSIPVFYNLFVANESDSLRVLDIVTEQRNLMRPEHKPFFVQSIGSFKLKIPGSTMLGHSRYGTEMKTLHSLWDFCKQNRRIHTVVYLHSKGSLRNSLENENLRKFVTAGALSKECASMDSSKCNVCSSRFSPLPHPHTSGNMWLARCDYVQKLIDPLDFEKSMNKFTTNCTEEAKESCDGRLRFSAEHWIHSHPSVKPCDLYPDPKFVWDYDGLPVNGTFNAELAQAPRFDLLKYVKWDKCVGRGVNLHNRLDEYWELYNEKPDATWWGWNFLPTSKSWIPEGGKLHRKKEVWRKRNMCWRGDVSKDLKRPKEQTAKQTRVEKREYILKNTSYYCPNGSRIEQGPGIERNVTSATASMISSKGRKERKKRVLVMAAVPRDKRHVLALWSQLECFTVGMDHVILATPRWSKEITTQIIDLTRERISRFSSGEVTIQAEYFVNDRYDVGLWCDAIKTLNTDEFDEFGLVNDSVFAMRNFTEIFDALSLKNVSLTSTGYSYTPKGFQGRSGPLHFWVESIYRGFTKTGIAIFQNYSCVPEDHPYFCPEENDNKACIVNNFEHDLASQYPCDKIYGIFPSDTPRNILKKNRQRLWNKNSVYWKILKQKLDFPLAKVNQPKQVRSLGPRLKECTKFYDDTVESIDLSLAKPRHRRSWADLENDLKLNANKILGFDQTTWQKWTSLEISQTPFDRLSEEQQSFLTLSLDCSPMSWNYDACGPTFE